MYFLFFEILMLFFLFYVVFIRSCTRSRHKKVIKLTKGFVGSQSKLFKIANQRMMKSFKYSYMHRKKLKNDFRSLWLIRLNIFCTLNDITYNKFKNFLKKQNIIINNKILGNLLLFDKNMLIFLIKQFK
jgi:large subunit ribosomal protein L20